MHGYVILQQRVDGFESDNDMLVNEDGTSLPRRSPLRDFDAAVVFFSAWYFCFLPHWTTTQI